MINLSKCFLTELLYVLKIVIWVNKMLQRRPNLHSQASKEFVGHYATAKKKLPKSSDVTMIETFREECYIKSRSLILCFSPRIKIFTMTSYCT